MNTKNPSNQTDCPSSSPAPSPTDDALSRRSILGTVAKAGGAILALGAVSQLGACSTAAQKMVDKKGGSIGQPIPSDPVVYTNKPSPVHTTTHKPIITAPTNLSAIPGFVVPRTKWTSSTPKRWLADPMNKVTRITVHHDAIMPRPSGSYADSVRRMNLIRKGHLNNGWADIGYHFAIDPEGRIWQARPLELQGAHVKNNNPGNLGIVVFGNYELIRPTQASLNAIDKMVAYAMGRFGVPLSRVYTHQELRSTACPGRHLQDQMLKTRARGGKIALAASQQTNHS